MSELGFLQQKHQETRGGGNLGLARSFAIPGVVAFVVIRPSSLGGGERLVNDKGGDDEEGGCAGESPQV